VYYLTQFLIFRGGGGGGVGVKLVSCTVFHSKKEEEILFNECWFFGGPSTDDKGFVQYWIRKLYYDF
jgi:hypothetical protein